LTFSNAQRMIKVHWPTWLAPRSREAFSRGVVEVYMSTSSEAAGSSRERAKAHPPKEFLVPRDNERPFSFSGYLLARASLEASMGMETVSAAVYETVGGKFITHLSKHSPIQNLAHALGPPPPLTAYYDDSPQSKPKAVARDGYSKAAVFDSLDTALCWFRPGRLTDAIRKQLGVDEPIRIE
jgi:hypothetical protein